MIQPLRKTSSFRCLLWVVVVLKKRWYCWQPIPFWKNEDNCQGHKSCFPQGGVHDNWHAASLDSAMLFHVVVVVTIVQCYTFHLELNLKLHPKCSTDHLATVWYISEIWKKKPTNIIIFQIATSNKLHTNRPSITLMEAALQVNVPLQDSKRRVSDRVII